MLTPAQTKAFRLLGVSPDAEPAVIRQAWRDLVRTYHPDQNSGNEAAANERLAALNAAYDVIQGIGFKKDLRTAADEEARAGMAAKQRAEAEVRKEAERKAAALQAETERRAELARQTRLARQAAQEQRAAEANIPSAEEEAAMAIAQARADARAAQNAERAAEQQRWTAADLKATRDAKKSFSVTSKIFRKSKDDRTRSHGFA